MYRIRGINAMICNVTREISSKHKLFEVDRKAIGVVEEHVQQKQLPVVKKPFQLVVLSVPNFIFINMIIVAI